MRWLGRVGYLLGPTLRAPYGANNQTIPAALSYSFSVDGDDDHRRPMHRRERGRPLAANMQDHAADDSYEKCEACEIIQNIVHQFFLQLKSYLLDGQFFTRTIRRFSTEAWWSGDGVCVCVSLVVVITCPKKAPERVRASTSSCRIFRLIKSITTSV